MANEFNLIDTYFAPLSGGLTHSELGIGDDGALLNAPYGKQLVVVTDTMVENVHFLTDCSPYDLAWKAVAVNVSDLVAMGATPAVFSLALTLPDNQLSWLSTFAKGLYDVAQRYNLILVGGDTTRGPLTVTVTAQGWVETGKAVLRSGAQVGDLICVSNTIGDGALGLKLATQKLPQSIQFSDSQQQFLLQALHQPQPQIQLCSILKAFAHSAIDISDGLLADLNHIVQASSSSSTSLAYQIDIAKLPLSEAAHYYLDLTHDWQDLVNGGDDYQIAFTLSKANYQGMLQTLKTMPEVDITVVGEIIQSANNQLLNDGLLLKANEVVHGYQHF